MASPFHENAEDAEGAGLQDLASELNKVTTEFCNRVVGAETIPDFSIDHRRHEEEFENCVNMLPKLDTLFMALTAEPDVQRIVELCKQITSQAGHATLVDVRQGLVHLRAAVIHFYEGFLANRFVQACPPGFLQVGAPVDIESIPDVTACDTKPKMAKMAKEKNIALTAIAKNMAIIVNQLAKLFLIIDSFINYKSVDCCVSNLSQHLSSNAAVQEIEAGKLQQKVHFVAQFILNTLQQQGAHKVIPDRRRTPKPTEVEVWIPVYYNNVSTGVYEKGPVLTAWIDQLLSRNPKFGVGCPDEIWKLAPWAIKAQLYEFVATQDDHRFPFDDPNPYLYAFTNGRFDSLQVKFFPDGGSEEAMDVRHINPDEVDDDNMEFIRQVAKEHNQRMGTQAYAFEFIRNSTNTQPCMFIPLYYDPSLPSKTPRELEDLAQSLKQMLEHQELPNDPVIPGKESERNDVRDWIYAIMGRTMINFEHRYDRWQIAPFFLGVAGTGKSTILNMIQRFFPEHTVKAMEDESETTFAFQTFVAEYTRLVVASEVPTNLSMAMIAKAISNEPVTVAVKNKGAFYLNPWLAALVFAGNKFPPRGNEAGRMSRRLVIIPFNTPVSNQQSDLEDHIKEHLPVYLTLCAMMYKIIGTKYGKKGFFSVAPQFFRQQTCNQFIQSNPLATFLNSPEFTRGAEYEIPLDLVENAAKTYAGGQQGRNAIMSHLVDTVSRTNVCNTLKLRITKTNVRKVYALTGREYNCLWIKGIALTSSIENSMQGA